ncbi:MAG: hypothetical protein ABL929_12040 [Ferruginibacter sp.]
MAALVLSPSLYRTYVYAYPPKGACIHISTSVSPQQPINSISFFSIYYAIKPSITP